MFALRGLVGVVSHALFSAVFCAGLMWALTPVRAQRNVPLGIVVMLAAMILHFAWDDLSGLGSGIVPIPVIIVIVVVIDFTVLLLVLRFAARGEREWMRDILQPEVTSGVMDTALLDAVSGFGKQHHAENRAAHGRRRGRHRIAAAHDLAQALATSEGTDNDDVAHARNEIRRLDTRTTHPTTRRDHSEPEHAQHAARSRSRIHPRKG